MAYIKELFTSAERYPLYHVNEGYYPDPVIQNDYESSLERNLNRLVRQEEKNTNLFKCITFVLGIAIVILFVIICIF
jgi:hypothetical protein